MEKYLSPRSLGGTVDAIASKSQAHRLLICAALADGPSRLHCGQLSRDIIATADGLRALGAEISYKNGIFTVIPIQIVRKNAVLPCGESGSTLRFLLPVAAALGADAVFQMEGRLPERPLSPLWEELEAHGCVLSRPTATTLRCEGQLCPGIFSLAGNVSSQFLSGLLFALPLLDAPSEIRLTTELESASYVEMTRRALAAFDVEGQWKLPPRTYRSKGDYTVEGDWSNAAFWLAAGAISCPVRIRGLDPDSPQGDRKIAELLAGFGAEVSVTAESIKVSPQPLKAMDIDVRDIPDLVPPLALVACCAEGISRIYGAERLRIKESDRLATVAATLNALGGQVEITEDGLLITGTALRGGRVQSFNDHRIAMMAAVASAVCTTPVELEAAEAVNKSYPTFWEVFSRMQGGMSYEQ